MVYYAID